MLYANHIQLLAEFLGYIEFMATFSLVMMQRKSDCIGINLHSQEFDKGKECVSVFHVF